MLTYVTGKDISTAAFHACGEDTPVKEYQYFGLGLRPRVRGKIPCKGGISIVKIIHLFSNAITLFAFIFTYSFTASKCLSINLAIGGSI